MGIWRAKARGRADVDAVLYLMFRMCRVIRLPERRGDTQVAKKYGAVFVDKQVGSFNVTMDEAIDVKITRGKIPDRRGKPTRGTCVLLSHRCGESEISRPGLTSAPRVPA